jgi:hypothetical protein
MAGAFEITQKHKDFDREWNAQRERIQGGWPGDPGPAREKEPGFSFHDLFPLFGIVFVVVGLGMLCSPLWMIHKARTTAYLVTDRRAIIFQGGWSTHVRSFGPSALGQLERREKGDGSGDIILAKEAHYTEGHYTAGYYSGTPGRGGHYVPGSWMPGRWSTKEIGFFGIPQVKHVEQLLRELAARRKEAGA